MPPAFPQGVACNASHTGLTYTYVYTYIPPDPAPALYFPLTTHTSKRASGLRYKTPPLLPLLPPPPHNTTPPLFPGQRHPITPPSERKERLSRLNSPTPTPTRHLDCNSASSPVQTLHRDFLLLQDKSQSRAKRRALTDLTPRPFQVVCAPSRKSLLQTSVTCIHPLSRTLPQRIAVPCARISSAYATILDGPL